MVMVSYNWIQMQLPAEPIQLRHDLVLRYDYWYNVTSKN